ncbi:unnamed protein product [Triticum turgidum subsp. durum]|uniref:Protein kinase domain-containing protein n=1 Tax=Triticum turgidum subsp. durum TaxID=4567 RepID=A0A9R0YKD0_TRITD|nr:unnamed protein product [Triticum turgidum subsp. durum]
MLYLSRNRFSGEIPADTFLPMRGLRKLHLHRNDFSGRVPSSITSPRLLELTLANNRFEGQLPDFSQPELRFVDVSNNNLSGPIPAGLGRFNATMFRGNKFLCGKPTDVVCESASSPAGGMSTFMRIVILLIILGVLLAAAGIAMGVLGRRRRRRRRAKRTDGCVTLPNGEVTPSNPPALSDYALVPVLTATHAAQVMMAYKAPECVGSHGKPSRKSDVWSLGILTLEVLTGKFPACRQGRQGTSDLAGWVNSVITEERTGEVFDKDMSGGKGNEEEMLKLLQVALTCCEADIDKRLDLKSALAGIEEIREPEPESSSTLTGEGESKS